MTTFDRASGNKFCGRCGKTFGDEYTFCPDDKLLLTLSAGDPFIGDTVADRYEIASIIGSGGWSMVYKARHKTLNKPVAIKVLHAHLVNDAENTARFQNEAETASKISHPNVVTIYDYGLLKQGQPYIAMDFVEGNPLAKILESERRLSLPRVLDLFSQACSGLAAVHKSGLIHRDLKPENMVILQDGSGKETVKIVDFGLVKPIEGGEMARLTTTGQTLGTPAYMSPEQCRGLALDARSDIYSLGCVMYECLTGLPPFGAASAYDCMEQHINGKPRYFEEVAPYATVPPFVEKIVFRAIAKNAADRYQSVEEMLVDINRAAELIGRGIGFKRNKVLAKAKSTLRRLKDKAGSSPQTVALAGSVLLIGGLVALFFTGQLKVTSQLPGDAISKQLATAEQDRNLGKTSAAKKTYYKVIGLLEQDKKPSESLIKAYSALADLQQQNDLNKSALTLYGKALAGAEQVYGTKSVQYLDLLNKEARCSIDLGDYAAAEKRLANALDLAKQIEKTQGPQTGRILHSIATCKYKAGLDKEAKELLETSVILLRQEESLQHTELPVALAELAYVEMNLDLLDRASEHSKLALQLRESGPRDKFLTWVIHCRSMVLHRMGHCSEANTCYKHQIALEERMLGADNPKFADVLEKYAAFLREIRQYDEADKIEARAQQIWDKVKG